MEFLIIFTLMDPFKVKNSSKRQTVLSCKRVKCLIAFRDTKLNNQNLSKKRDWNFWTKIEKIAKTELYWFYVTCFWDFAPPPHPPFLMSQRITFPPPLLWTTVSQPPPLPLFRTLRNMTMLPKRASLWVSVIFFILGSWSTYRASKKGNA